MIHDVFYQFSYDVKFFVKRQEVDLLFYDILKDNNFRFAKVYYGFVRWFGWLFWGKKR